MKTFEHELLIAYCGLTNLVTAPWEWSIPNRPARPAICLVYAELSKDIFTPSNFSKLWNTIRLMFLLREMKNWNGFGLVAYRLRPIPTASVATMILQWDCGSLNICACWTLVARKQVLIRPHCRACNMRVAYQEEGFRTPLHTSALLLPLSSTESQRPASLRKL